MGPDIHFRVTYEVLDTSCLTVDNFHSFALIPYGVANSNIEQQI